VWRVADLLGRIPVLDLVRAVRERFQQDEQVDQAARNELASCIHGSPQTYTAEEDALINKVHAKLGALEWEHFDELESPDHLVKKGKMFVDGEKDVTFRGIATIDALVEQCAAWDLMKMSREHMMRRNNTERKLTRINEHHGVYRFVRDLHIPSLRPREWIMKSVWKWRDALTLEIAYEHNPDHELFPRSPKSSSTLVRDGNTSTVHYLLEQLPNSSICGGLPQTRVTFTQTVNLGGVAPKWAVARQSVGQLMYLSTMRTRFDKSLEVDGATRALNVEMITEHADEYSAEETKSLEDGEQQFEVFNTMRAKALEMASPLTRAEIAFKRGDRGQSCVGLGDD